MVKETIRNFDMNQISRSGQCFRIKRVGDNKYFVTAYDRAIIISQEDGITYFDCEKAEFEEFWKSYFDMDADYAGYTDKIDPADLYLLKAANFGSGIRILRQNIWETIVSFLISQQNNIARITKCIENICEKYGERKVASWGETYYAFPSPKSLAALGEDDLMACNLGYRSKYVVRAAKDICSGKVNPGKLMSMTYEEAKAELLKMYGVGEKVADCICLFALHHLEAFPVDTHINQALRNHYKDGFPDERYNGYQGVMQQYIFYYELFGADISENIS